MRPVMAVYDRDPFYGDRLADVWNQKGRLPFRVMAFSSIERLTAYAKQTPVELLLVGQQSMEDVLPDFGKTRMITLAEGETVSAGHAYPSVYKYQNSESLIREVMAYYCKQPFEEEISLPGAGHLILGVYSPLGRCLKTSFALTLGQFLSRDSKVLYINLEAYAGFSSLLQIRYKEDLSDLMYGYGQGNFKVAELAGLVHTIGELDYIPPPRYPEDVEQLSSEQMADLLVKISRESGYEILVVDMGQYGRQVLPILQICKQIYMPVKQDCLSVAKLEEFSQYLELLGHQELEERIQRLLLPYHSSFGSQSQYMELLPWGELGDYVRQLVQGQKSLWNS